MIERASRRDLSDAHARPGPAAPGPAPAAPARATLARRPQPVADGLGRALAAAVAARAPEDSPLLARVEKKQKNTTTKTSGGIKKKQHKAATITQPKALATLVAPPRRSGRARHSPNEHDDQIHWSGPTWGAAWDDVAGGESVRADLGPAAGQPVNRGGVPEETSCTAVNWLNLNAYDGKLWIKGHLLNDNLGGWGVSKNLTPMTHTANMQFQGQFESKVKNALTVSYSRAGFGLDGRGHYYGVRFAVDVVGQAWPAAMEEEVQAVPAQVVATASYIEKVGNAAPVPAVAPPAALPALPAGQVVIDCDI